jgi:hypothetical protein
MDLAENIGAVKGYNHLLVVMCNLSDFILIYPLKSKTNAEISRVLRDGVLQTFHVERIRSDNGPGFRSTAWLETMAALGVEVINSSSLNPSANGGIERAIKTVKMLYKKLLATRPDYNWDYLNFIVSKIHNTTINPRNNCKPAELVFGKGTQSNSFLEIEKLAPPHHLVKNNLAEIETLTKDIEKLSKVTKERLDTIRLLSAEKLNKTRINKDLKENDYVFILDRAEIPGATRPLRTKLDPSPYVILKVKYTTVLVRRLSDGFTSLYSMNDVKKYDSTSDLFKDIPREIARVLLHDFVDLLSEDFSTIIKHDPLKVPNGLPITEKLKENPSKLLDRNLSDTEIDEEYLKELQKDMEKQDLIELQNDKDLKEKFNDLEVEQQDSEEEDEVSGENNGWETRLRKRVTFEK